MKLSIVIPVYNGSQTIKELVGQIKNELIDLEYEVVLVNDCSPDNSEAVCSEIASEYSNVVFISLRKNSGEHNAVMCGLNHVSGDYTIIMDDDFQNPPSEIMKLYNEAKKGYDVVYSKYLKKKHSIYRNLGSKFTDKMAVLLIGKPKNLYLSSFKIINNDVVKELIKYKGPFPYIDGLILRVTNNITSVFVEHALRNQGQSNYSFSRLLSLYMNMFINFSIKPIRLMIFSGLGIFLIGIVMSLLFIIENYTHSNMPVGWTAIAILIITFSGFQILFLGLLGEYIGKQYLDQNSTPQWTVKFVKRRKD